jgi:DNA-binding transcriptional LysR family regulator
MPRTGLGEYEAAVVLARRANFRAAARDLGVSPSALSNTIAGLEARLGVRLFNRTTRSVAMTEAGEQFVARVAPALAEIDGAVEGVNSHRQTPAGTLRINTVAEAARRIVAPIIAEYLRRYPEMKVDIATDSALVDIVAGGFDAGIRWAETVPQDMIAVQIAPEERRAVVGSPEYFSENPKPMTPGDLLSHRCIRGRLGSGVIWRWPFESHGAEMAVEVQGPLTLDEPNVMLDAALAGIGIAYLNEAQVAEELAAGRLVRALEDWTPPYSGYALYYPGRRHVPAGLRALIELIREIRRTAS